MTNTERDQQYPHAWNATAVTTGKGVCMSYAYAFKGIADEAGLRSIVVLGNAYGDDGQGGAHAWNLVKASDGSGVPSTARGTTMVPCPCKTG